MARRTGTPPLPPPLEMACLGAVWTRGEATVREVAEALEGRQALAYTTVMTLLERLVKRGKLERRKVGRSFIYRAAQNPDELRQVAVEELVRNYFGGSREALREWLAGAGAGVEVVEPIDTEPIDTALL